MRPLLVGQAPGPNTDPTLPLFPVPRTSAGGRLQELMGLTRGEYLKTFERVNLLYEFPGRHKRDDKFPMMLAWPAAQAMRPLLAGRTVVLVGRNVASAFELEAEFHEWVEWPVRRPCLLSRDPGTARVAVIPHPSGRNHWYNDPANREAARSFWEALLRPEPAADGADRKVLSLSPVRSM